jgi:hypothetical protein
MAAGVVAIGCGGPSSPSMPSNRATPAPDATVTSENCYPYVKRDGACLTACDPSKPQIEQGCVISDWPLICNSDGTCTPEQDFD